MELIEKRRSSKKQKEEWEKDLGKPAKKIDYEKLDPIEEFRIRSL